MPSFFNTITDGSHDSDRVEESRLVLEVLKTWGMGRLRHRVQEADGLLSFEALEREVDLPVAFRCGRPRGFSRECLLVQALFSFEKTSLMKLYLRTFDAEWRADTICALLFGGTHEGRGMVMHNAGISVVGGYKNASLVVTNPEDSQEQFVVERRRAFYAAHAPN